MVFQDSTTLSDEQVAEKAATAFAVVRAMCYPESSVTSANRVPSINSGRTHARTNGSWLTSINADAYRSKEIEERFGLILHEVSHHKGGPGYGRGRCGHNPDFWAEVERNWHRVTGVESNKRVIEALFEPDMHVSFDWHRAAYRMVQDVSQVDKRSETVDERKEKMARGIGYDGVNEFEVGKDWGLCVGRNDSLFHCDATVFLNHYHGRFADSFSDDELLEFIREWDGMVPAPLVIVGRDEKVDGVEPRQRVDEWYLYRGAVETSRKALAVQDRIGFGLYGLSVELLHDVDRKERWSDSLPIPVEEFPDKVPRAGPHPTTR